MVKRNTIDYKVIGKKKSSKDIYGTIYKILQIRKIRKCIKISKKFYIPINLIRKKTKLLYVWKPLRGMVLGKKPSLFIVNKYFDDYFLEFNDIKIKKEVKSKKLLDKLTKQK